RLACSRSSIVPLGIPGNQLISARLRSQNCLYLISFEANTPRIPAPWSSSAAVIRLSITTGFPARNCQTWSTFSVRFRSQNCLESIIEAKNSGRGAAGFIRSYVISNLEFAVDFVRQAEAAADVVWHA